MIVALHLLGVFFKSTLLDENQEIFLRNWILNGVTDRWKEAR